MMKRFIFFTAIPFLLVGTLNSLSAQTLRVIPVDENNVSQTADDIMVILNDPNSRLPNYGDIRNDIAIFLEEVINEKPFDEMNSIPYADPEIVTESGFLVTLRFPALTSTTQNLKVQPGAMYLKMPQNHATNISPILQSTFQYDFTDLKSTLIAFSVCDITKDTRGKIQIIVIGEKNILKTGGSSVD